MRRMASIILCLPLVSTVAQADPSWSPAPLDQCLAETQERQDLPGCAGEAASACFESDASSGSDADMRFCVAQELMVWEAMLAEAFEGARTHARTWDAPERVVMVDEMQAAWEAYRDATCTHRVLRWTGGEPGNGYEEQACHLFETARKVFAVHENMREGW